MEKIAIIDFGGQYTHLIARRIRDLGVFSEIYHPEEFRFSKEFVGIILSGGPKSVNHKVIDEFSFDLKFTSVPILGICFGHQFVAEILGGTLENGDKTEYGSTNINIDNNSILFQNFTVKQKVWMSHGDHVAKLPKNLKITASTSSIPIAAYESEDKKYFGLQFHPEVTHTDNGIKILDNFINVCTNIREWNSKFYKDKLIKYIREKAENKKLIVLLSGGVDSLVALELCIQAIGCKNIFSFHIDTGFMRKNESSELMQYFGELGYENIKIIKAEDRFLTALYEVTDPEQKRLIIGKLFVDIANDELKKLSLSENWLLVQGTIYPDTIESGSTSKSAKIKTHHNRVTEIENLIKQGKVIEPLENLYKDEVRKLGKQLGLSEKLVNRHPFPGPGLAIRIICSDGKFEENFNAEQHDLSELIRNYGLSGKILPICSVGVQGDYRTYKHPVAIWFDDLATFSWEKLRNCSVKIVNNFKSINRVVFSLEMMTSLQLRELFLEKENLDRLREIDALMRSFTDEISEIWQMPVVQLPLFDENNKQCYVIRPVCSQDAMSADCYKMSLTNIKKIIEKTVQKHNVGKIFYDITTKPPGTIEWE